jgi:LmbE family N-acetylglucosaminyl deacetylase
MMNQVEKMAPTLVISPHMDDAALSLGLALLAGSLGKKPTIVNVFTRSNYTIDNAGTGDVEVVTEIRKAEEKRACQLMRVNVEFLDFEEVLVRGVVKAEELLKKRYNPARDPIYGRVAETLTALVETAMPAVVIFPLALGGHVEHRLLNNIGRDFLSSGKTNIAFYEDLPYASTTAIRKIKRVARRLNRNLVSFALPGVEIENKVSLLKTYKSQLREIDLNIIRQFHAFRGDEHLWATRRVMERFHSAIGT